MAHTQLFHTGTPPSPPVRPTEAMVAGRLEIVKYRV